MKRGIVGRGLAARVAFTITDAMSSFRTLPILLSLIAALLVPIPDAYAQIGPGPCPDGELRGSTGDPEDGKVIGDIIASGIVFIGSHLVSSGHFSVSPQGAAGVRLQRHFPVRSWDGAFVGLGVHALPTADPGSGSANFGFDSTDPHFEVSTGYTFRMSNVIGNTPGWRRAGVSVEVNAFLGDVDRIQVAVAPRFNVLQTNGQALFIGAYVSQTAIGGLESPGPSFGFTVGISRSGDMLR